MKFFKRLLAILVIALSLPSCGQVAFAPDGGHTSITSNSDYTALQEFLKDDPGAVSELDRLTAEYEAGLISKEEYLRRLYELLGIEPPKDGAQGSQGDQGPQGEPGTSPVLEFEYEEVYTYSNGPAHKQGDDGFNGLTLLPNGKVMFAPHFSTYIGIYDPVANTYSNGPSVSSLNIQSNSCYFINTVSLLDGKVLLIPHVPLGFGIYDPVANTYSNGPAHGQVNNAFASAVVAPDGKIILAPANSPYVGIYDPVANTYSNGPAHGQVNNAFAGAVVAPDGKIILAPANSPYIGIYDPVANTYSNGPAHGHKEYAFYMATLVPDGKVILAPSSSPYVGILSKERILTAINGFPLRTP